VFVEIVYRYPKWVRTDDASRPLVEKWDRYMKNLITHENGHRDMVAEAAAELTRAVAGLPPAATCAEIDRKVKALCRERMEKLTEDQKGYDAATEHGVKQGAVFP
jgi:predicted secreted Zn-dependent protease